MTRVRDLLYRFRPAGAPGAARATGVPADRVADLSAELEPLLVQLAETEQECASIIAAAEHDASAIRTRDAERARVIVASARSRADAERARAAATVRQGAADRASHELAAAELEAAELRTHAAGRVPSYVAAVLDSTRALVEAHVDQQRAGVS
jgi:hypothetical protein